MSWVASKRFWAIGALIILASHLLFKNSQSVSNIDTTVTPTAGDNSVIIPTKGQESPEENVNSVVNSNTPEMAKLLENEILPRLGRIRKICGPLCEVDSATKLDALTVKRNKRRDKETMLPSVRAPVDCLAILKSEDIDASENSVPYPLPFELHSLYSLNGLVEILNWGRHVNVYLGQEGKSTNWNEEKINDILNELKDGVHLGTYGIESTNSVLHHLNVTRKILGSRVLVIGSEIPWLEAICLLLGAKEVVTLEYGKIVSTHPKIKTLTPSEFRKEYMDKSLGLFDTIVSFSSLEHSGLGRYGDALNPWGDLLAVARSWCVTRRGGALVLGLPTGKDRVMMNAHRVYGKFRWPLVAANWIQVDSHLHNVTELAAEVLSNDHSVFVFEKLEGIK